MLLPDYEIQKYSLKINNMTCNLSWKGVSNIGNIDDNIRYTLDPVSADYKWNAVFDKRWRSLANS